MSFVFGACFFSPYVAGPEAGNTDEDDDGPGS